MELHLTPAGEDALRHAQRVTEGFEAALAGALGAERHGKLVALLAEVRPIVDELRLEPPLPDATT